MSPIAWVTEKWEWARNLRDTRVFGPFAEWAGWRWLTPALAFLALASLGAYRELEGLLKATHLPGAGSFGAGDLANVGFHAPDSAVPGQIIQTWTNGAPSDVHGPERLARWAMYVDFGLIPIYCSLLALWLIKVGAGLRAAGGNKIIVRRLSRKRISTTTATSTTATLAQARSRVRKLIGYYRLIVALALLLVPLLALADLLENAFTLLVLDSGGKHWFWELWLASLAKTVLFVLVAGAAAIATVALVSFRTESWHRVFGTLSALRAQLLLVVLFCGVAALDPTGQAQDAIRRWEPDWTQSLAPLILTLLFGFLVAVDARRLLELAMRQRWPEDGYGRKGPVVLIAGGVATVLLAIATNAAWGFGIGLAAPGAIAILIGLLSLFVHGLPTEDPGETLMAPRLTAVLATVPPVLFGLAVFRASFSEWAYSGHPDYIWLVAAGLAYMLVGWFVYPVLRILEGPAALPLRLVLRIGAAGVAVVFFVGTIIDPWSFGQAVGTLGALTASLLGAALIAYFAVRVAERVHPPQALVLLRLRRIPVFTLLLLWVVLAAVFDRSGRYYDVRILHGSGSAVSCAADAPRRLARFWCHDLTPQEFLTHWLARNAPGRKGKKILRSPRGSRKAVPLVFVAAEGGGIRAAYWTASVLRCTLEPAAPKGCVRPRSAPQRVFAASGVSGGSLGLVSYAAHEGLDPAGKNWPRSRLDHDFLAPAWSWALFVDMPMSLIRRDGGTDRAEVLERAWQDAWGSADDHSTLANGFYALARRDWKGKTKHHVPLLLLNGTRVQDGCRFETSPAATAVGSGPQGSPVKADNPLVQDCLAVRLFERASKDPEGNSLYVPPANRNAWTLGATTDLAADLCPGDDVRLSTAALLSARFPLVSPSGRLQKCGGGSSVNVVDGGYFETSASATITEFWDSLRSVVSRHNAASSTCVVPVLIQIDNHYHGAPGPSAASRPLESQVPLTTLAGSRNAREAEARQAAALAFGHASFDGLTAHARGEMGAVDRFAHIYPRAHPGTQAPLGWTLSKAAESDLDSQLTSPENEDEFKKIRSWFSPNLTCARS